MRKNILTRLKKLENLSQEQGFDVRSLSDEELGARINTLLRKTGYERPLDTLDDYRRLIRELQSDLELKRMEKPM